MHCNPKFGRIIADCFHSRLKLEEYYVFRMENLIGKFRPLARPYREGAAAPLPAGIHPFWVKKRPDPKDQIAYEGALYA